MGKARLMIVLVLNIALTIGVIGFSFTQARPSSNANLDTSLCNSFGVVTPIRIQDKSGNYGVCPWSDKQSAIRLLIDLIGLIILIALIVFLFKRKRYSYIFAIVVLFVVGGFSGYSAVTDGLLIKKTRDFCNDENFDSILAGGECNLKFFYGTVATGFGATIMYIISSILAIKYRSAIFNDHHHHHHQDDEKTPIIGNTNNSSATAVDSI